MFIDPIISLIALATLCFFYIPISIFLKGRLERNSKVVDLGQKKIVRFIQEALGGIRNLILDKSHDFFITKYNEIDFNLRDAVAENKFLGSVPRYVIEALVVILMALLGLYYAYQPNGMNEGLPILGFIALASQKLIPNMQQIYIDVMLQLLVAKKTLMTPSKFSIKSLSLMMIVYHLKKLSMILINYLLEIFHLGTLKVNH